VAAIGIRTASVPLPDKSFMLRSWVQAWEIAPMFDTYLQATIFGRDLGKAHSELLVVLFDAATERKLHEYARPSEQIITV
jgi:hypothetical protein